jgi:hypothetical protein
MSTLRNQIEVLAEKFTAGIIAAIRDSSLHDLLAAGPGTSGGKRGPGRPRLHADGGGEIPTLLKRPAAKKGKGGRLARRSDSDIQHVIGLIVATLGSHKAGLRSEQIQKILKLDKKEIAGPLAKALGEKKIVKTGKKRATTYFAK